MKNQTALIIQTQQLRLQLASDRRVTFDEPLRQEVVQILALLLLAASKANNIVAEASDEDR